MRAYNLLKLVDRYGRDLTLIKSAIGPYDPATGSATGITENFIFTGYMYDEQAGVLTSDIRRGTRKCVIPPTNLGTVPDDGDQISGSGDVVSIKSVATMYSGSTVVCYICEVSE